MWTMSTIRPQNKNIYNTINDNFKAFDSLLNYFSNNIKKNSNNYQIKKLSIN